MTVLTRMSLAAMSVDGTLIRILLLMAGIESNPGPNNDIPTGLMLEKVMQHEWILAEESEHHCELSVGKSNGISLFLKHAYAVKKKTILL